MLRQVSKACLLGLTLASISACSPVATQFSGADMQKRNIVQHVRIVETISISSSSNGQLSNESKSQINDFINFNKLGYGDTISLDVGEGQSQNWQLVRKHLLSMGHQLQDNAPITGQAPQEGMGVLIVDRFVVTPPNCHNSEQVGVNIPITVTSPAFGCSHQANLGLMIANPQDLIEPEPTKNTNAEVASGAVSSYRLGRAAKGTQISSPLSGK